MPPSPEADSSSASVPRVFAGGGGLGTAALEEGGRVDFAALRAARRARLFEAMERAGLDACLFGREANARYVSGARRLWWGRTALRGRI